MVMIAVRHTSIRVLHACFLWSRRDAFCWLLICTFARKAVGPGNLETGKFPSFLHTWSHILPLAALSMINPAAQEPRAEASCYCHLMDIEYSQFVQQNLRFFYRKSFPSTWLGKQHSVSESLGRSFWSHRQGETVMVKGLDFNRVLNSETPL